MTPILYLAACFLVLILPGAAWQVYWPLKGSDPLEKILETVGISIALTALAAYLLWLPGIQLGTLGLALLYCIPMIALVFPLLRRQIFPLFSPGWLLALAVLGCAVFWRLLQARILLLPAWVDSPQHVLAIRVILENGGLPVDYSPYLDVPFYYHFGYHVVAALLSLISGLDPARATLIFGQVINALASLAVYRLGRALWGNPLRAGFAALLVVFAMRMPAYYLTWGRYTLLTGMFLLPLALAALLELRKDPGDRRAAIRLALYTAALACTHFQAFYLLGLFFLCLLLTDGLRPALRREWRNLPWRVAAALAVGVVLVIPWIFYVLDLSDSFLGFSVVSPLADSVEGDWKYYLNLAGPLQNQILFGLALPGLVLAWLKPRSRPLALWTTLIVLLALPFGLRIRPFRPDHMIIILYLPASLLLAEGLFRLGQVLQRLAKGHRLVWLAPGLASLGLLIWGGFITREIINPVTVLADEADVQALAWVKENIPEDAKFFINTLGWQQNIYRGVDGGTWITPLTGRGTLVPPITYGWGSIELVAEIAGWAEQASKLTTCDEVFFEVVQDANLTHVYLKEGVGSMQPGAVTSCRRFKEVYNKDKVHIYEIIGWD